MLFGVLTDHPKARNSCWYLFHDSHGQRLISDHRTLSIHPAEQTPITVRHSLDSGWQGLEGCGEVGAGVFIDKGKTWEGAGRSVHTLSDKWQSLTYPGKGSSKQE